MHEHVSPDANPRFSILICSSTRTEDNDTSGIALKRLLDENKLKLVEYRIVKDSLELISDSVKKMVEECDILVISGGTGITEFDVTIQAVRSIAEKEITGFGIQFQVLSREQVGSSSMLSNATGFIVSRKAVFCLPGSVNAVNLGMTKLIIPESGHILHEIRR